MINRIIAAVFSLIGICIVANAQQGSTNVGRTGAAIPLYGGLLGLNSGGNLVGWPGDTASGAWVNIKASSLGVTEGAAFSGGVSTGQPVMGYVITAPPSGGSAFITGTFDFPTLTVNGAMRVDEASVAGTLRVADPCQTAAKIGLPISQIGNTQLITGTTAKKNYICSISIFSADAENVSLVEGTGTLCATNIAAIIGSTTAANGIHMAANSNFNEGMGGSVVALAATPVAAANMCLLQSGSGNISGNLTYVKQ